MSPLTDEIPDPINLDDLSWLDDDGVVENYDEVAFTAEVVNSGLSMTLGLDWMNAIPLVQRVLADVDGVPAPTEGYVVLWFDPAGEQWNCIYVSPDLDPSDILIEAANTGMAALLIDVERFW